MTEEQVAQLRGLIRREQATLLRYVHQAELYVTATDRGLAGRVRQMAAVENEGLERLVQYLARHRISSPPAPSYPAAFTAINYTSLKHLVPRLIEEQRQLTDLADMDVSRLGPVPRPLEQILTHYVALKRRHSEKLAALAQAPKVP